MRSNIIIFPNFIDNYLVSNAACAAASTSKFFEAKRSDLVKFVDFGDIWANLSKIWVNLGKIWASLIRFSQNQNLVSPKQFDLLRLCQSVFTPRQ